MMHKGFAMSIRYLKLQYSVTQDASKWQSNSSQTPLPQIKVRSGTINYSQGSKIKPLANILSE